MTDVIVIFPFGLFLPFYPPNSLKNENLKKKKKHLEITSLYNSVPKIMIIFYIAPELWRVTVVIVVFPFGLFLALLPPPSNNAKTETFKKTKKTPGYIIISHKCIINHDHMPYCS